MNWILFGTDPMKERKVASLLESMGFKSFVPMQVVHGRTRGSFHKVVTPRIRVAYPRHVFLGFDCGLEQIPWDRLRKLQPDILKSLRTHDGVPWSFTTEQINCLDHEATLTPQPTHKFNPGDKARLTTCGFVGCDLEIEEITDEEAKGLVMLFGQPTRIKVPVIDLEEAV